LPRTVEGVRALVDSLGPTPIATGFAPVTADELVAAVEAGVAAATVAAGWQAIVQAIDRRLDAAMARRGVAIALFGCHHDSAAQIDAFARIVGPLGSKGVRIVGLELLQTRGRWRDAASAEASASDGDDDAVAAYGATGSREALEQLLAGQREHDYTAWKFGYLDRVVELFVAVRAADRRMIACDLSSRLQRELLGLGPEIDRLREASCALALADAFSSHAPRRAALLWGSAHLADGGLPRVLAQLGDVSRIEMIGGRPGEVGVDAAVARRLVVIDPLLVPVADRMVLVLSNVAAASIDRVREISGSPAGAVGKVSVAGVPGVWWAGGKRAVGGAAISLPPGPHAFAVPLRDRLVVGGLHVPDRGQVAIDVFEDRSIRMLERVE
jgi:hypothetical protein